mmetsp:Transcript_9731/g.27222  ORF Transcript_9731/g.27222 Transcript_9731/m.27222 type:complete len:455 (-) Transcript_9731:166-1530(-)
MGSAAGEEAPAQTAAAGRKEPSRKAFFGDVFRDGRYKPLHSDLFNREAPGRWRGWLAPSFADAVAAARAGSPHSALREEAPGVYSFELFTPEFCTLLLEEVEHAQRTCREELERPNGMNRYGIVLNQLGLEPIITSLQQEYILPLQRLLYPEEGAEADDHHCFIVRYKADEDVGLDMHEDDSDVTLNVCLGKEFEGATLSFCGLACDDDHRKLKHTYQHRRGRAVIHVGRQRHGADNIASGERVNFILWSTSRRYRSSEAYQRQRMRSTTAAAPDPICLSYTHDRDYTKHLEKPTTEQALARGVMLDVVERRHDMYQRPVHDLTRPLQEINEVPSFCVFLESLPPPVQHQLFGELVELATDVKGRAREPSGDGAPKAPPLLFFVAVSPKGAVPQIRSLLGLTHSPAVAILDVDKECCYRLDAEQLVDGKSMRSFVEAFLKGDLMSEPLGGESAA